MAITAQDVARLRTMTGAGMMDCKNALDEAQGDMDKAADILRKKGIAKAAKRAEKIAAEGLVASYIHAGGRIGVLLEVNCETDFVAQTDAFKALVNDVGMHIAAMNPKYLSKEEVTVEDLEKEKSVYRAQLEAEGKPANMIEKIVEGKMARYYSEMCLLEQPFIKDEEKTVSQLIVTKSAETGEKMSIRRFVRFELGEGMAKKSNDFAAEVQAQLSC